jgi:2'-5' RNA ligase
MSSWFVALPVTAGDWFSRLSPTPSGTRLLAAEDLHLTVAFLGAVGEARARAVFDSLPPAVIPCFKIILGAVVPMGNPRRPSALSVQIEGAGGEGRSIADVLTAPRDAMLEAAALPAERRPMKPHVTLARLRRKASPQQRQKAFAWAEESDLASTRIRLDQIGLYTAARDRRAHAYEIIETRDLRP